MQEPVKPLNGGIRHYWWLLLGVLSVSSAAILIRLADADPLIIATYRMAIATVAVAVPTVISSRSHLGSLKRSQVSLLVISGGFLALHFASWISSLSLTSVGNSVFLVTTSPIFVAVGSYLYFRDHISPKLFLAILATLAGGVLLTLSDGVRDQSALLGDGLAIVGALSIAGYLLVGRSLRTSIPTLPYVTMVYGIATLFLLAGSIISGASLAGITLETYLWMTLAALIPQALGHSILNWALTNMSTNLIAISIRLEPIIATILAIFILGELPNVLIIPASILILSGVILAVVSEHRRYAIPGSMD